MVIILEKPTLLWRSTWKFYKIWNIKLFPQLFDWFSTTKNQAPYPGAFWVAGLETLGSSSMVRADNPKMFYIRRLCESALVYLKKLFMMYCAVRYHLHNLKKKWKTPLAECCFLKLSLLHGCFHVFYLYKWHQIVQSIKFVSEVFIDHFI